MPFTTGRSRPSLSQRVEKLGALLGHLKAFGSSAALRKPAYRMLFARSLVYLLPGLGLLMASGESYVIAVLLLIAAPLAAGLLLFYDVGQRGRMAYHVERFARGEPSDAKGANAAISGKRGKLALLGCMEWFERKLQKGRDSKDSGIVSGLIAGVLGEILDVAGAFLVPAVVLDDVGLKEGVEKIKELKSRAPEALLASVGFDAAASLLSSIFWIPVILIPMGAIGATVAGWLSIPQAAGIVGVLALLLAVPLAATQTVREAAKAVYFTSLYLLIAHPEDVSGEHTESLEGLVRMTAPDETPEPVAGRVA